MKVPDALARRGGANVPIVSSALRAILGRFEPPDLELLPVTILDAAGKVASRDYVIANSFHVIDCLDLEQVQVEWNPLGPASIASCEGLVLKEIAGGPAMFRAKHFERRVLTRRDVTAASSGAQLTGLYFQELSAITA